MKKVLIFCLSAALLLVSLTACHKPQADQPTEPDPPQTVTTTQADVSTPEPAPAPLTPEPLADAAPAPQELSQDELHQLFQYAYDSQKDLDLSDIEVKIGLELDLLQAAVDMHNRQLPSDYEEQYRAWRPADPEPTEEVETSQPPQETAPQQPPKTSTNTPTPASSEPEQQKPAEQQKPVEQAPPSTGEIDQDRLNELQNDPDSILGGGWYIGEDGTWWMGNGIGADNYGEIIN